MTTYLGSIEVADGYAGKRTVVYLCQEPSGRILAVCYHGWFTWHSEA